MRYGATNRAGENESRMEVARKICWAVDSRNFYVGVRSTRRVVTSPENTGFTAGLLPACLPAYLPTCPPARLPALSGCLYCTLQYKWYRQTPQVFRIPSHRKLSYRISTGKS